MVDHFKSLFVPVLLMRASRKFRDFAYKPVEGIATAAKTGALIGKGGRGGGVNI